jgi:L-lactate dehydrogenase complex protein LldG
MNSGNSRELILQKVKAALANVPKTTEAAPEVKKNVFVKSGEDDLSVVFAENLIKNMGEFIYAESIDEFFSLFKAVITQKNLTSIYVWEENLANLLKDVQGIKTDKKYFLEDARAGVTSCESIIARTGSFFMSSASLSGRTLSIFPPIHIVVAYTSQIVWDLDEGLAAIKNKYKSNNIPSLISLVTGPSRTADIEKTLVLGAHGPKELIVFLIDDTSVY